MRIEASPKIRDRKPGENAKPEHRFVVRDNADRDRPRRIGAATIFKFSIGVIVLLVGGLAILSAMKGPDPHYLNAKKLVHDYQFGKPVESRNYEHRIYGDALDELALVNPRSKSADAAEALKVDIERGIADFRRRQEAIEESLNQARAKKRRRQAIELEARARVRDFPQIDYPECDEEELGVKQEPGHAHSKKQARL